MCRAAAERKRQAEAVQRSMHVEEVSLTKEEIVHDKRPENSDVVIEKIINEQAHPNINNIGDNKKLLRRQKTRDKLILARDTFVKESKTGSKPWYDIIPYYPLFPFTFFRTNF